MLRRSESQAAAAARLSTPHGFDSCKHAIVWLSPAAFGHREEVTDDDAKRMFQSSAGAKKKKKHPTKSSTEPKVKVQEAAKGPRLPMH
ncbi:unnamed protein product [Jaminaea pallidilutea]